jgi:hypothetical protein
VVSACGGGASSTAPSTATTEPIIAAQLNSMIADATYAAILARWHAADSAVDKAQVNPSLS